MGCCNHDAHRALKWALHYQFLDKELLKNCFIVVQSLRNAYDLLYQHLAMWVVSKVKFTASPASPGELSILWTALGVEPEWVEALAPLGLIFRSG